MISAPLFYGMGTVLFVFYTHHTTLPKDFNTSSIVPYFILTEMPPFVAGLMIAAIFAAAQSTISSSLNSMAACLSVDIKQRFFGKKSEEAEVRFARLATIVVGLLGMLISLYLIAANSNDVWDLFLLITGLFGVPIAGIFAVGIFTKRTHGIGVIIGIIVAVIVSYFLQGVGGAGSPFYVSIIAFITAFVTAYIASLIIPAPNKDISGLTIFDKHGAITYERKVK